MAETYTARIIKNSSWAMLSFIMTTLASVISSVVLTHYLSKENYGDYSYFLWFTTIMSIVSGIGLSQTVTKYLPRYFFQNQEKAQHFFRSIFKIALLAVLVVSVVFFIFNQNFQIIFHFHDTAPGLFLIAACAIFPLCLNILFVASLSAVQDFKKLSVVQIIGSIINVLGIVTLVIFNQPLSSFLWFVFLQNVVLCLAYFVALKKFFTPSRPSIIEKKEIVHYTFWSYLTTVFGQIAWERSEIFFLGIFSDPVQIGVYSLAYGLAVLFIGAFGPINTVLTNVTSEVMGKNNTETFADICQHASKYLAIIIFPAAILSSFFIGEIVQLFYGNKFTEVSFFFPLLVLSHTFAIVFTPASNVAYFKNEVRRMTIFTVFTGTLNIFLDMILIPRYQLWGAVFANSIAQGVSVILVLINARKYKLHLFNRYMINVLVLNFLMGCIFFYAWSLQLNILLKIAIAIAWLSIHVFALIKNAFNQKDISILQNVTPLIPQRFHQFFHKLLKIIERVSAKNHEPAS